MDPKNGKLPPITDEGKRILAARAEEAKRLGGRWDSAQSNQLDDRCIIMAGAGPPMMDAAYNSNYQIVQAPGYVMILTEMIHDVRIIPLDGRPQPPTNVRQWMGVSRGRWEGDTLVVETTNFNGKNPLEGLDREHEGDRASAARRRRHDRVQLHGRGQEHVGAALVRGGRDEEDRRVRCSSTRATKATTVCTTRSSAPGARNSRRPPTAAAKKDSK